MTRFYIFIQATCACNFSFLTHVELVKLLSVGPVKVEILRGHLMYASLLLNSDTPIHKKKEAVKINTSILLHMLDHHIYDDFCLLLARKSITGGFADFGIQIPPDFLFHFSSFIYQE